MQVRSLDRQRVIFTVPGLLSPAECQEQVALAEGIGFAEAPISTWMGPVMNTDVRNNTRVILDDRARAAALWERVRGVVPADLDGWTACGLNERFRFYRYEPGQAFRWHRDGAYARSDEERSLLTFLVYLNGDCLGGETEFSEHELERCSRVRPREGLGLFFEHPLLHQGSEVLAGVKYVLRTDVMYRRGSRSG